MWRCRRARGPDVELLLPLPIAIAIESKRTAADALDKVSQVISYAMSGRYDAVFLRLDVPSKEGDEDLKRLKAIVGPHGIGIIVGGYPYSPLTELEALLQKAFLGLNSDPLDLIKDMGSSIHTMEVSLDSLLLLRKYFKVSCREC